MVPKLLNWLVLGLLLIPLTSAISYIGESGLGWNVEEILDPLEEVTTKIFEVNETVVEVVIDEYPQAGLPNNYRWKMALCNNTGSGLQINYGEGGGVYSPLDWENVPYAYLIDYGMNETWCSNTGGYGYPLFSTGSLNQLPLEFRLKSHGITNFTTHTGTGSAVNIADSVAFATAGPGDNICRDQNGVIHGSWEGVGDDVWYGNSTDNGQTWTSKDVYNGTIQNVAITCGLEAITIAFAESDIKTINSTTDGASWTSPTTVIDIDSDILVDTSCDIDSNGVVHCIGLARAEDNIFYGNTSDVGGAINLTGQDDNQTSGGTIAVDIDNNVYIIGFQNKVGTSTKGAWIWSSIDSWGSKNPVQHFIQIELNDNVVVDGGMNINANGTMVFTHTINGDVWVCDNVTSSWNHGLWDCDEIAVDIIRSGEPVITQTGHTYVFMDRHANPRFSNLSYTVSTDNRVTWADWVETDPLRAGQGSIQNSLFPIFNRINDTIRYIFQNNSASGDQDVWYHNWSVTAPSTCLYQGGDWTINLGDHCIINDEQDVGANAISLEGTGSLTIESGGILRGNIFSFIPSSTSMFSIFTGGIFEII